MKIKFINQVGYVTHSCGGHADEQYTVSEMILPVLDGNDAVIIKKVIMGYNEMKYFFSPAACPTFQWGISGDDDFMSYVPPGMILYSDLMTYSVRNANINLADLSIEDPVYGHQDQISLVENAYGFLDVYPIKRVFFNVSVTNMVLMDVVFRAYYDVVTLTSTELLEMYSSGITI
jgi:hypothetical protein